MPDSHQLRGRLLVVAFEGWNDAGEAASSVTSTLCDQLDVVKLASFDSENYFDYQQVRPRILTAEGQRVIQWPEISFYAPTVPSERTDSSTQVGDMPITGQNDSNIYLLAGPEPSRNWKSLGSEIVDLALAADVDVVIFLGALLADVPHTRAIPIFASSENAEVRQLLDVERSSYEGPTGILAVLAQAFEQVGISTLSLWASVPHYVHHSPSPKATLALIDKLEELIDVTIPRGQLVEDTQEWEENIDALASQDEEMSAYIRNLETVRDEATAQEMSGEALAREFEQYLRDSTDGQSTKDTD